MATGPKYRVKLRRIRERKTNYKKRLKLLKSGKPRMVVRVFNNSVVVQFIEFHEAGDRTIASATSRDLVKLGWKAHGGNTPAAYLVGYLAALRAKKKGVTEAVLDIGFHTPVHGSSVFAALKGALDAGIDIPHSEDALPSEDRIKGEHIAKYAKILKEKAPEKFQRQFSAYLKKGFDPENFPKHFEEMLAKVKEAVA